MAIGDVDEVVAAHRRLAGDHLVHHRAERVEIGAGVGLLRARLLRRNVEQRSHDGAGRAVLERRLRLGELGQAEVEHLHVAVGPQHDVFRLDVAVDDAGVVRGGERAGDADGDVEHFAGIEPPFGHRSRSVSPSMYSVAM